LEEARYINIPSGSSSKESERENVRIDRNPGEVPGKESGELHRT